jgi:DNA helicase-2/ATP-dependent DNA helicase PcrA
LLRIINTPRRGISEKTLDHLTQENRKQDIPLFEILKQVKQDQTLPERAIKNICLFVGTIESAQSKFKTSSLSEAFSWLLDEINYKQAITEDVKSEKMRDFKWENVTFCVDALSQYEEENQSHTPSLQDFLATTLLDKEKFQERSLDKTQDRVNLMTFHSAKGLEFTACFLIGIEDHILPHEKSMTKQGIEEERRLMYVAMTRAKKLLTLSMSLVRKRMGKEMKSNPSRFIFEIPKDLLDVTTWKKNQ